MKKSKKLFLILDFIIIIAIITSNIELKNKNVISTKTIDFGLTNTEEVDSKIVNAKDYGIVSGTDSSNKENNTTKMQELIDICKNGKTIYFPKGEYLIGAINLGDSNNISIKGENSENTKIIYQKTEETETFLSETASRIQLENLSFQGSLTEEGAEGTNFITGGNGQTRCRVVANKCRFTNWGTVFGGARYVNETLEFENSESNKNNYKLIAVLGMDCAFENNNIAISQIQDSRIVRCDFNNNKYDIIIDKGAGASVVTNNKTTNTQIESIIVNQAHDTNIANNELNSKGIQINNSENINVYQNKILGSSSLISSKNSNISNNQMNIEQISNNENCIVQNNDAEVTKTTIDVVNECDTDQSKYVNVLDFGVKAGLTKKQMNVDDSIKKETIIKENTENIQKAIEYCIANSKILYFPSGDYLTNTLNISDTDIIISGTSNNMIFYSNNSLGDNYSRIVYCGDADLPLFNCTNTNMKLQNIGIYGTVKSNGVTYGTEGATAIKNDDGNLLVNQCEFANWNIVLENGKIDSINSRFSYNNTALKNLKKSNIEFSSFNKNDYAIYLENSNVDINLKYNRIEWNNINGIYVSGYTGEKLVIEGNELDRQSNAGMYLVNSKNIDINGNIIRRSGSADALSETDENEIYEKNVQMYINNCNDINVENNITVAKYNYDAKPTSETSVYKISPYKVSNITNNSKINVKYNIMNGAKDISEINKVNNFQSSYQSNIGIDDNETHIVTYKYLAENGEETTVGSQLYAKDEDIDLSITVSKDGYKFLGWNTDENSTEILKTLKMGSQDITLYAIFEKEPEPTHIVTYKYLAENGEEVTADSKEYAKDEEIDLSITATKDGYKFLGWNTDKNATEILKILKMGSQDITLYAIFEKEPEPDNGDKDDNQQPDNEDKNDNQQPDNVDKDENTKEDNKGEFDLALKKWVTQTIITDSTGQSVTNTGNQPYDSQNQIVKVELNRKKLDEVTVKFKYSIRVINEGDIAGYAKEVTDYIPEGLKFIATDNQGWTEKGNNVITTNLLENKLLKPGEFADVEVTLTWINNQDNMGVKVNTAEISKDYNEYGISDKDSTPNNKKAGEDDIANATVMLSISTGKVKTYFSLGMVALIAIAGGVASIKKFVL